MKSVIEKEKGLEHFPKQVELNKGSVELHLMTRADEQRMLSFAQALPEHDLMFLRRDITRPEVIKAWVDKIEAGGTVTVIADQCGEMIGYGTLSFSDYSWSRHVAELRVMVRPDKRDSGAGRFLTREVFRLALANGVEKMVARMTLDQTAARKLFQELGFRPEALLEDEVKDRHGELHDVLVMAVNVQAMLAKRDAFGLG